MINIFKNILRAKENRSKTEKAIKFVKDNRRKIINQIAGRAPIAKEGEVALAMFMAGSPGAGKTEFSKGLLTNLNTLGKKTVRIDPDEIREMIPKDIYDGKNAHLMQKAITKGVNVIFDYLMEKQKKNFLLDGTFASYEPARKNIARALEHGYVVEIWYIYQDPRASWHLTKAREAIEGRRIRKFDFINAFFESRKNVNNVKAEFGNQVKLNLIVKNYLDPAIMEEHLDIQSIDGELDLRYHLPSQWKIYALLGKRIRKLTQKRI